MRERSPTKLTLGLLLAEIAWGALSFGGVYPWGYWSLAAISTGLAVWIIAFTGGWKGLVSTGLDWTLCVIAAVIALDAIPLPFGVFARVAPGANRFLSDYELGYDLRLPAWHAVSIGPVETHVALALFVPSLLLFLSLRRVMSLLPIERLARDLTWLALSLALLALVQRAMMPPGPQALVYGFWHSLHGGSPFGPFINRNHFAGWQVMVLPVILAYSCALLERMPKPPTRDLPGWLTWSATPEASRFAFVACAVLVIGTAVAVTRSRSGMFSFAVAVLFLSFQMRRRTQQRVVRALAVAYVVMLIIGAIGWAGMQSTITRFSSSQADLSVGRLPAWRDTARIIADFPIFGTGPGTYGMAMLIYQTGDRTSFYQDAHNDYLQVVAEGGVLLAVPVVAALVLGVREIRRRLREGDADPVRQWVRIGAVAGLVGIGAQSVVEFTLQMPGVRILFVTLAAIALHKRERVRTHAHRV